jgi:hypothetical protein
MVGARVHEAHLGGLLLTILLEPRAIGVFLRQIGGVLYAFSVSVRRADG